jgi:hypothetical protein
MVIAITLVWACQRMEENRIRKKIITYEFGNRGWEVDQEIDGKMKWGRMEE